MVVWNDLEVDDKIKVYDKGVERSNDTGDHALRVSYRTGDLWVPRLEQVEALARETLYFTDCIRNNHTPINDGLSGLRVVRMLEAVDRSMAKKGGTVYCKPTSTKTRLKESVMAVSA